MKNIQTVNLDRVTAGVTRLTSRVTGRLVADLCCIDNDSILILKTSSERYITNSFFAGLLEVSMRGNPHKEIYLECTSGDTIDSRTIKALSKTVQKLHGVQTDFINRSSNLKTITFPHAE